MTGAKIVSSKHEIPGSALAKTYDGCAEGLISQKAAYEDDLSPIVDVWG